MKGEFVLNQSPKYSLKFAANAVNFVNRSFNRSTSIKDFAKLVQEHFSAKHGDGWQVLVGNDISVYIRYRRGACLVFSSKKEKLKVIVYRPAKDAGPVPQPDHSENLKENGSNALRVVIKETTASESFQTTFMKLMQEIVSTYPKNADLSESVGEKMKYTLTKHYGSTWHIAVCNPSKAFTFVPSYYIKDSYVEGSFCTPSNRAVCQFIVFQHNGYENATEIPLAILSMAHRVVALLACTVFVMHAYFHFNCPEELTSLTRLFPSEDQSGSANFFRVWQLFTGGDSMVNVTGTDSSAEQLSAAEATWIEKCSMFHPVTFFVGIFLVSIAIGLRMCKWIISWKYSQQRKPLPTLDSSKRSRNKYSK